MGGMGLKVGVYGGGGYAGIELVRLLAGHPEVGVMSVASRGYVGLGIGDVYPQLAVDGAYVGPEEIEASDLDVAFVAYGHGESADAVKELLRSGTRLVIDLSADFRLPHEELYVEWYGEHPAPELLGEASRQPRLLSDGGYSGSCSCGEAYGGGDNLRYHQRSFRGERCGGEAECKDALRQRERECRRLWGAAAQTHA